VGWLQSQSFSASNRATGTFQFLQELHRGPDCPDGFFVLSKPTLNGEPILLVSDSVANDDNPSEIRRFFVNPFWRRERHPDLTGWKTRIGDPEDAAAAGIDAPRHEDNQD
jgi:hypothetical protein